MHGSPSRGQDGRLGPREVGVAAETLAAAHLAAAGWTVLARNVRVGRDEIDILAVDPGPPRRLVIVEVRARSRRTHGLAEETLTAAKRSRLRRAAAALAAGSSQASSGGRRASPAASPTSGPPAGGVRAIRPPRPAGLRPVGLPAIDLVVVEPDPDDAAPPRLRHHRDVLVDG